MAPVFIFLISLTGIGGAAAFDNLSAPIQVDANGCTANGINMTNKAVDCSSVGPMVSTVGKNKAGHNEPNDGFNMFR